MAYLFVGNGYSSPSFIKGQKLLDVLFDVPPEEWVDVREGEVVQKKLDQVNLLVVADMILVFHFIVETKGD